MRNINNVTPENDLSMLQRGVDKQNDIVQIFSTVRRGRRIIIAAAVVFVALAVAYLAIETPLYQAESQIIIDTVTSRAMQSEDQNPSAAAGPDTIDNNLIDSEVELLSSDGFARKIVHSLGLDHDKEFIGPPNRVIPMILWWAQNRVAQIKSLFGLHSDQPDNPEQRAAEAFSKRLVAKRNALTYVITISFSSDDRNRAAQIANAIADAYLKSILEAKYAAARRTGQWLQEQLAEVRKRATDDDRAVQVFKSENNIVDTNRGLMSEQQLADLNSQLVLAKAAVAETKAKFDRARNMTNNAGQTSTLFDEINNPVMARLRAQYLDLSVRAGDLASRFNPQHGAVLLIKNQMKQVQQSMDDEVARLVGAYESDYKIALARQNSLQSSLDRLVSDNTPASLAQVKLKDLENSADTSRALLTGYLQKYQKASQLETFPISDARVITEAEGPLKANNPKAALVLAGGLAAGLLLGTMAVVARELLSSAFVTGEDIEDFTGLTFLGVLPKVKVSRKRRSPFRKGASGVTGGEVTAVTYTNMVDTYVSDAPFSRFAETIRSIKVAVDGLRLGESRGKIIGVISAAPSEGKTTVALNLAQNIANAGSRTLIIDCDVRTRALSTRVGVSADGVSGLLEAVMDRDTLKLRSTFLEDERTGLYVLPCVRTKGNGNAAEILSSEGMAELLSNLRKVFDYIVLDIAPVVPVVDARAIAHFVDGFLLVVKWRVTSRKMVQEATSMDNIEHRILGAVLNHVDVKALKDLEAYRGSGANNYYME